MSILFYSHIHTPSFFGLLKPEIPQPVGMHSPSWPQQDPDDEVIEVHQYVEWRRQPHHVVILVNQIVDVVPPDVLGLGFYLAKRLTASHDKI